MNRILISILALFVSLNAFAEISEKQMRNAAAKVIRETIRSAKLKENYQPIATKYLNGLMLDKQSIAMMVSIAKEAKIEDEAHAMEMGFSVGNLVREKSILRLSSNDQYELLKSNILIISKMTKFECAQYYRKKPTDENGNGRGIYEIAGNLQLDDFRRYIGGYEKASKLLLMNKDESSKFTKMELEQVKSSAGELFSSLGKEHKYVTDFYAAGKTFATGTDDEICNIGNLILNLIVSGDPVEARYRATAYLNGQLL